jgi:hypothetical protein
MLTAHEQLRTVIVRYTPTLLDAVAAADPAEIARLAAAAGELPQDYREFLQWMGAQCPFLDAEQLEYTPRQLLDDVYEDADFTVPAGFIWAAMDTSGNEVSVFIRVADGAVVRAGYFRRVLIDSLIVENTSFASFLATSYVRKTLVPSHPLNFTAAFTGDAQRTRELWRRVGEACGHFEIPYPLVHPDFRLFGGKDFVVGVHQPPGSAIVNLHFGATDRARYESWYDLVFARWRLLNMPA